MRSTENKFPNARILVIDDNIENAKLAERFLTWAGYWDIRTIIDSSKAMEAIEQSTPDLVLLDLHMPGIDGYEILGLLRNGSSISRSIPVLVFTADQNPEAKSRALEAGASDFLTKPGDAAEILLRVRNFLQLRQMHIQLQRQNEVLEEQVNIRTQELNSARKEALEALARAAEFRDDDTKSHTKRVGEMAARIALKIGETDDFIDTIRLTAPLHDVGKIALPDSILLKPGKLTDEEVEIMRKHTILSEQVFSGMESPLMLQAMDIALNHHERWDGTGYPNGIEGEQIPLSARIVAVADVYDALIHERPYKRAWSHDEAMHEIWRQNGRQFDPMVVEAFCEVIEQIRAEDSKPPSDPHDIHHGHGHGRASA